MAKKFVAGIVVATGNRADDTTPRHRDVSDRPTQTARGRI
jgi:hypothetical protein